MSSKKNVTKFSALAILIVVIAIGSFYAGTLSVPAPKEKTITSVKFILNSSPSGEHAGFVAALAQGYYAQEGLSVTILQGYSSTDTVKRVFSGEGDFGNVDLNTVIQADSEGLNLTMVAMTYHQSPVGIFGLPGKGPTTISEVYGKKIGSTHGATYRMFVIWCAVNGINMDKDVTMVYMSQDAKIPAIMAGQVDAILGYEGVEAVQIAHAADIPKATSILMRDSGLDIYGNGITTRASFIKDHPDIVQSFVRASLKGVGWAINHPVEAATTLSNIYPENELNATIDEWQGTIPLIWNNETMKNGIGFMIPEKVQNNMNACVKAFGIAQFPIDRVYTNDFVKDLPNEIRFPGPVS